MGNILFNAEKKYKLIVFKGANIQKAFKITKYILNSLQTI